jgi:hypothetical protein
MFSGLSDTVKAFVFYCLAFGLGLATVLLVPVFGEQPYESASSIRVRPAAIVCASPVESWLAK